MSILIDTGILAAILDETAVSFVLSGKQKNALTSGEQVFVSPISFYEIAQKVRIGKWPEMAPYAHRLTEITREANVDIHVLNGPILNQAALMEWEHRDPFDRIIVATAQHRAVMPIVTIDRAIIDFHAETVV